MNFRIARHLSRAQQRHFALLPQSPQRRIVVTVINHLGDEVMKVFRVG